MTGSFHQATLLNPQPFLELNNQGQMLCLYLKAETHRLGRGQEWADLAVPEIGWEVLSRKQAVLCKEGEDYRIYDGDGQSPSRNGLFIDRTRITQEGYLLKNGAHLEIGQSPTNRVLVTYINPAFSRLIMPSRRRLSFRGLTDWPIELGRAPSAEIYSSMELNSPLVSRLHATLYPNAQGGHILQDLSTNGTFVDGKRVERRMPLTSGNVIQIGPFNLLYRKDSLELVNAGSQTRLDVHQLCRKVQDKEGREKFILNDVSFVIEPGQLVALLGGSGAGKSTLMKTLLGIEPTTSGKVFLNGNDLRRNWGIYRSQIGYVPQDDIVHLDLTVEEVLTFGCKLRLPPDIDVKQVVNSTLEQVKLSHVRSTTVRYLSGGQRKRVSMGVELLADPKLFFLDEPTSGLDPGLDKEMMRLMRELADQGRTVVLVTHATANIEVCDRIVFLGRGGKLCYFGTPLRALKFFEMPAEDLKYFSDIYLKLDQGATSAENQMTVDHWSRHYLRSPEYQTYVHGVLSPGKESQFATDDAIHTGISPLKQLVLLSQRYLRLNLRDRASLIFTLMSGPIAVGLTAWILQDTEPLRQLDPPKITQFSAALKTLFVFSCIAIWIGLSSSIREIVKEAAIYARERLINLGLLPYLGSKFLVRAGLVAVQTLLITFAVVLGFHSPDSELLPWFWGFGITNFLTLLASLSLSLMISAAVKNESEANNLLPLIMIPQIILSGVLFDLNGLPSKLAWLMISRWSIGAYGVLVNVNEMVPQAAAGATSEIEQFVKTNPVYDATWHNLMLNWEILALHTVIYLAIALWLQKRKDII